MNETKIENFPAQTQAVKAPVWDKPGDPNPTAVGKDGEPGEPVTHAPGLGRRFTIRTPNGSFNGERFGVKIAEGVGFTDDANAAEAAIACGYCVEDHAGKKKK